MVSNPSGGLRIRTALSVLLTFLWLLTLGAEPATAFFSGRTFDDRRQAYINDQGRKWERYFPGMIRMPLWAWLETTLEAKRQGLPQSQWDSWKPYSWTDPATGVEKPRSQLISQAIEFHLNEGWAPGAFDGSVPVPRLYFQYYADPATRVISDADGAKLLEYLVYLAPGPDQPTALWCAVANWHFPTLVLAYLGASKLGTQEKTYYPSPDSQYRCPPSFSYNGHSYTGGNYYDSKTILRDYLEFEMDNLLRGGEEEDLSPAAYYTFQIHSMALLYDFAPDETIRHKAKMLLDWLVFHYSVGISANHLAGGHGRHYSEFEWGGQDSFPVGILFNLSPDPMTRWSSYTDLYVSAYRPPQYAIDFFESINSGARTETDDYYRIIRGHNAALGDRYDYITPNYNLGGTLLGTHWELNIQGGDKPFKVFFCADHPAEVDKACNSGETPYRLHYLFELGQNGSQHRNALLYEGYGGFIHEVLEGQSWDDASNESGWEFRRKGDVAVAMRIAGSNGGALEVATLGVDYPDYSSFRNAVISHASISAFVFTTSKGLRIGKGYIDYGADYTRLPFDRLEVWEGHVGQNDERKVVDWQSNVMTVAKNGRTCTYDFNAWTFTGDGCDGGAPPDTTFADVPSSHWARAEIEALYQGGYVVGCSTSPRKFCPGDFMIRAESAVFVARGVHGGSFTPAQPASTPYADVPLSEWFSKWAKQLWDDGLTAGCGVAPLIFCPSLGHTRAEGAVFFLRMKNGRDYQPPAPSQSHYTDVALSAWYADWVEAAYQDGLTQECEAPQQREDRSYRPEDGLTRAEAACMMAKAKGLSSR